MRIIEKKTNKETGSIEAKFCMCKGRSSCTDDKKLVRHFKSKTTFDAFKRAFGMK